MQRPAILLNGEPIPWRLLNEEEQVRLDRDRAAGKRIRDRLRETGKISPDDIVWCQACFDVDVGLCEVHSGRRKFYAVLQATPQGGDDLSYTDLPEDFDEVHVRWPSSNGGNFHMMIDEASPTT